MPWGFKGILPSLRGIANPCLRDQGLYVEVQFLKIRHTLWPKLTHYGVVLMYAVVKSGGKQYKVQEGDSIRVERLDAEEGESIKLADVLMVADGEAILIGAPLVKDAEVDATVKTHGRGPKIKVVKFRRRKHHRKQMGHRQAYTELKITAIKTQ